MSDILMPSDEHFRQIAILLIAVDSMLSEDHKDAKAAFGWALGVERSLQTDSTWMGERHDGDCTGQPFTCNRCLVEKFEGVARDLWSLEYE